MDDDDIAGDEFEEPALVEEEILVATARKRHVRFRSPIKNGRVRSPVTVKLTDRRETRSAKKAREAREAEEVQLRGRTLHFGGDEDEVEA